MFSIVGGFLLMIGSSVEPSVGVWVVSIGGSLLTAALGKDKALYEIFLHIIIGLFWGIFGSQIIHSMFISVPQIAASFFAAMFGVEATWFFIRNFREGSLSSIIVEVLTNLVPWLKKKDK
jgi:hypothetical protein